MPKEIKSSFITEDTIDPISKFQILVELDKDEIKSLLGEEGSDYQRTIAKLMKFKPRELVINEGDFDSWVFWIVKGEFAVGDTILVRKHDGTKLAKAKSNYSSCLLNFITNQEDKNFASDFQEQTGPIISDKHVALLETL